MPKRSHTYVLFALVAVLVGFAVRAGAQSGIGPPNQRVPPPPPPATVGFLAVGAQPVPETVLASTYGVALQPRIALLFPAAPEDSITDEIEVEFLIAMMDSSYVWVENVDDDPVANAPPWGGSGTWCAFGIQRVMWVTESPFRGISPNAHPGASGAVMLADGHYAQASSNQPIPAYDGALDYWGPSGRRMGTYSTSHSTLYRRTFTDGVDHWPAEFAPDGSALTVAVPGGVVPAHQLWYSPRGMPYVSNWNLGGHDAHQVAAMHAQVRAPSMVVKATVRGRLVDPP